jgi:hypothetical protein
MTREPSVWRTFLEDESYYVTGVEIYSSSQIGGWSRKESGWSGQTTLRGDTRSVFFNGMLHLVVIEAAIVAIDVQDSKGRHGGPLLCHQLLVIAVKIVVT